MLNPASAIVVLTGAGISAESGLSTYRGASDEALWKKYDFHKLATPQAFAEDPALVHEFYNLRRRAVLAAEPNAAHLALVALERAMNAHGGNFTLISQNVDDLHGRAGSANLLAMHGSLVHVRCLGCGANYRCDSDVSIETACPQCGEAGGLRPDVVWFGEIPRYLDQIEEALEMADLFVSIGTSGSVYPAAGLVAVARARGIPAIEFNLEPSDNASLFCEGHYGPASRLVPDWVKQVTPISFA